MKINLFLDTPNNFSVKVSSKNIILSWKPIKEIENIRYEILNSTTKNKETLINRTQIIKPLSSSEGQKVCYSLKACLEKNNICSQEIDKCLIIDYTPPKIENRFHKNEALENENLIIKTEIRDNVLIDTNSVKISYKIDEEEEVTKNMHKSGENIYEFVFPKETLLKGTLIKYKILTQGLSWKQNNF